MSDLAIDAPLGNHTLRMSRRLPRGQETRERILAEALRLFARRGYVQVSVEDIAQAAGVTKGAVYYWFTDKDDLGQVLQRDLWHRIASASLRVVDPDVDALTNVRRCFMAYLDVLESFDEARFFLRDAWVIPALDEAGRLERAEALEYVRGVLAAAIARGEIVDLDPDALASVLFGVFNEATLHLLQTGDRASTLAVVERFLHGLRPDPEAPPAAVGRTRRTKGMRR